VNRREHYREAERLLEEATELPNGLATLTVAHAQVHATLATVESNVSVLATMETKGLAETVYDPD